MQTELKDRILDVLEKEANVPIHRIAEEVNISVPTASKYCYVLQAENKLTIVNFGNMKLVSKL